MTTRYAAWKSVVDKEMMRYLVSENKLSLLNMSQSIYGGTCPFCKRGRSFTLWSDKGTFRCFWCGCNGKFVITPERLYEEKLKAAELKQLQLAANEEVSSGRSL